MQTQTYLVEFYHTLWKACHLESSYNFTKELLFLTNNLPYEVNISKLASYLELNKSTVINYLNAMKNAELVHLLYADNKSVTKMQKPDKIYAHNTNILYALSTNNVFGTIRECFVVNQLSVMHTVEYGKITFEVCGFVIINRILVFEPGFAKPKLSISFRCFLEGGVEAFTKMMYERFA